LVRFRTGDIIEITGTGKARCGRTAPRFRVTGRSDDMVVVRGINVFPTQIAAVLNSFAELSGEYRIMLEGRGPFDRLPVEAEIAEGARTAESLAAAVERRIKAEIGVTARLTMLPFNSLPRSEGKTRRVIRRQDR
jgi:phenylacetate-CoA ligase